MIDEAKALGLSFDADMEKQIQPDPRGVVHDSYTTCSNCCRTNPEVRLASTAPDKRRRGGVTLTVSR